MNRTVVKGICVCLVASFAGLLYAQCRNDACVEIWAWQNDTKDPKTCWSLSVYGQNRLKWLTCDTCPGTKGNYYCKASAANQLSCELDIFASPSLWQYDWAQCSSACAGVPNASFKETTPGGNTISVTPNVARFQCVAHSP